MSEEAFFALVRRQDDGSAADACLAEPADLTNMPLRIGSIFIILAGSLLGAIMPIVLSRPSSRMHVPKATFFVLKYVGTGVIIATAWIHLLSPAVEALHDECLADRLGEYDWAFAIGLMTVMMMFLVELLAAHASNRVFGQDDDVEKRPHATVQAERCDHNAKKADDDSNTGALSDERNIPGLPDDISYPPGGQDHLGHARHHREARVDGAKTATPVESTDLSANDESTTTTPPHTVAEKDSSSSVDYHSSHESIASQLTAIFILEFGVIFHSIFIGLALATSPDLTILLIVLLFHQTLEGLGLGSRLAVAPWPPRRRWVPYVLGACYAISTPLAIAIGINARASNVATSLLVQGIFDAISAGILLYTGMVELLAHEFMFNPHMRNAPLRVQLFAFGCVALGAGVMALLGKWA